MRNPNAEALDLTPHYLFDRDVMSWQPLPVHRHLATVGIGAVFVCPPPHTLPHHEGDEDLITEAGPVLPVDKIIQTWEIHGDIKSTPEDFIVREIGMAPPPQQYSVPDVTTEEENEKLKGIKNGHGDKSRHGWCRSIAGLGCESQGITTSLLPHTDTNHRPENTCSGSSQLIYEVVPHDEKEPRVDLEKEHAPTGQPKSEDADSNKQTNINAISESKRNDLPSIKNGRKEAERESSGQTQPLEALRTILFRCTTNDEAETQMSEANQQEVVDRFVENLSALQALANNEIRHLWDQGYHESRNCDVNNDNDGEQDDDNNSEPAVWIPTANLFENTSDPKIDHKDDWKHLHQFIREAFPFLRTENPSNLNSSGNRGAEKEKANVIGGSTKRNDTKKNRFGPNSIEKIKHWVCVLIDRTLFGLAPYLHDPNVDLFELYKFRQRGPIPPTASELNSARGNNRGGRDQKRRRNYGKFRRDLKPQLSQQQTLDGRGDETIQTKSLNSSEGLAVLRLRPELPRDQRRNIHRILSGGGSQRRDFETFTMSNFPLSGNMDSYEYENDNKDNSTTTTAIIVHWSNKALSSLQKKRKRQHDNDSDTNARNIVDESMMATFCVLRKEQVEHQAAVQHIARALKCKQQDIGLAGIKDMHAITYQFCTLRNISIQRAKGASRALTGKRVELSRFVLVHDFFLNRGDLIGNRFEVVLRNLKRIERMASNTQNGTIVWKERAIPCNSSHIDAMVKRVGEFGFINFYGEQRVGDAGHSSRVGVRSYDVGRAMLRRNFAQAIDLIMTGRSYELHHPGDDEVKAREVWKNSGGDARATLNAFPKNESTMVRERDLLKGLVRYGDPLEAIQCVPRNVRMFWIHSYQSYVWNIVATERIKLWGLRPKIGDLYEVSSFEQDGNNCDNINVVEDPDDVSIYQVVLPLPGYNVRYPSNEIGSLYNKILHNDGVNLNEKCNIQEATAKGSYRRIIQKATNLKWEKVCDTSSEGEDPVIDAIQLSFDLKSGCYATMLLRELMLTTMVRDGKISA